ncbi:MAG TPA: hypothetical protein VFH94_14750 [Streptomyces sp.]|jgi:hypothetical protein|nr:hypothetical protein [Streptomyces sp.]
MAKAATPLFPAPSFKFPEPKLPKLDLDALFATQKANLAAVQEAQSVLIDAAQAIAKVQHDYLGQSMAAVRAALSRKELAKPDAVLAEIKVAVERISATTKQVMDFAVVAVAAQHRAVELVTRRTRANVSELKALAA